MKYAAAIKIGRVWTFAAGVMRSCKQACSRTDTPPEGPRKKGIPEDARKTQALRRNRRLEIAADQLPPKPLPPPPPPAAAAAQLHLHQTRPQTAEFAILADWDLYLDIDTAGGFNKIQCQYRPVVFPEYFI
ncbi:hypothetical protein EAI_06383 [Harpegnathos saltator]|uniref:Uncharacterized protein n=1 Tax=Harpegnathos saltator TaxID=610380 RepID=E2BGJ6_HARSA|nr:hypothetical protein EAI_06383 [Harpegnathos saltator]